MKRSLFTILLTALMVCSAFLAQAEDNSCGQSLLGTLDAATRAKIERIASKIPNGKGRFWKIEKAGIAPSWLMGTMHDPDPEITRLSPAEQAAFDSSERVALELREILQGADVLLGPLAKDPTKFMYLGKDSLKSAMTPQQFAKFNTALEKHGLSYPILSRMKPWIIWAVLSQPNCHKINKGESQEAFDAQLGRQALAHNKEVIGLETPDEQFQAIDDLPINFYVDNIMQLAEIGDHFNDYYATMREMYINGDIAQMIPLMDALTPGETNSDDLKAFNRILINDRNKRMAERASPLLKQGGTFIAVGALHLIGETGLVEAFRKQGYSVTRGQ